MAKIDFFIVFLPFIELAWTMLRDPISPDIGARVTCAGTTIEQYRSGFATNSAFDSTKPPRHACPKPPNCPKSALSMKAFIHHNPACGTSRKTLEILRESGADVTINEYLKTPPSRDELKRLYDRAGISPREGLRSKEPLAEELGLTRPDVSDDAILDAMVEHPVLINRPIVETDKGVRLCRPQDTVREIL
jgi:arsenate reductase (glutaredoxin)